VVDKRLKIINGIRVDIVSLLSISHKCVPGVCSSNMCCCSQYEICIDDRELERITAYIPAASEWAHELRCGSGFENVFDETGDDLYSIDTDEDDLCIFAYPGVKNSVLCSLHTVALDLKLPPVEVKPISCATWPLAVSYNNPHILSVAEDAFDFPCNTKNTKGLLDHGISCIIKDVYGEEFLKAVQDASALLVE
jgi:hypothetical protein